ncbi:MAG: N-acetylmuramic acid 6-phosphate etherase [Eubacteriales bacterium]|jgi:N-acetylmuramic acid 6-phosphate etherase
MSYDYKSLLTEAVNEISYNIDKMSSAEIVRLINEEDKTVAGAVSQVLDSVAKAVDEIAARLAVGGRLIYIGAGTSGRLGVLDAAECPPTYGVSPGLIQGLIAGRREAMFRAAEGAEDNGEAAVSDLMSIGFSAADVCFGISASGSAEYVVSAIKYAKSLGALTVALCCSEGARSAALADIAITPLTGPEVIAGSTRMKAGTAQKMVLNMISTGVMIKLGRVWHNMMVCMKPTNRKLLDRAARIISHETGVDAELAREALEKCGGNILEAIEFLKSC